MPWKVTNLDVTCAQFVDMCALEKLFMVSEAQLLKTHFFSENDRNFVEKSRVRKGKAPDSSEPNRIPSESVKLCLSLHNVFSESK